MPVSEAQKKAVNKYLQGLDEFKIRLPKGYKDILKEHTSKTGESINAFVKRAVDETIRDDEQEF